MKKVIIAFLILLVSSELFSGEFSSRGMKIGVNSARFTGKDIPGKGVQSMPGFSIGGFFSYKFNERFTLQPEILFTTKGSKINTIGDIYLTNLFAYFEFPVMAKISLYPESRLKPGFICGPALGFKYFALNDTGILEDVRGTDLGLIAGFGIEYWKLSFEIRLNQGLINFDTSEDELVLKNRVISIMMGYSF